MQTIYLEANHICKKQYLSLKTCKIMHARPSQDAEDVLSKVHTLSARKICF